MTILTVGLMAERYDTKMARAFAEAVFAALVEGRGLLDLAGVVPKGWGL